jgi:hypothetical protein
MFAAAGPDAEGLNLTTTGTEPEVGITKGTVGETTTKSGLSDNTPVTFIAFVNPMFVAVSDLSEKLPTLAASGVPQAFKPKHGPGFGGGSNPSEKTVRVTALALRPAVTSAEEFVNMSIVTFTSAIASKYLNRSPENIRARLLGHETCMVEVPVPALTLNVSFWVKAVNGR